MTINSASALAIAAFSMVLGITVLSWPSNGPRGVTLANYPACVENASGADCQKTQGASERSRSGRATMHEHERYNGGA
jgi:hypothetical protein